jgi:hypothetical protein
MQSRHTENVAVRFPQKSTKNALEPFRCADGGDNGKQVFPVYSETTPDRSEKRGLSEQKILSDWWDIRKPWLMGFPTPLQNPYAYQKGVSLVLARLETHGPTPPARTVA